MFQTLARTKELLGSFIFPALTQARRGTEFNRLPTDHRARSLTVSG